MWSQNESRILKTLDAAVRSPTVAAQIDEIVSRVEGQLAAEPGAVLAWEPIPLRFYDVPLPQGIQSSWVFVMRANTATGAERHPNSHQRMMSYRGTGDFQTKSANEWSSHLLTSDPTAPLAERWISIPRNVWHQGVVPGSDWVVVSFHTVPADELIEERPSPDEEESFQRRKYVAGADDSREKETLQRGLRRGKDGAERI